MKDMSPVKSIKSRTDLANEEFYIKKEDVDKRSKSKTNRKSQMSIDDDAFEQDIASLSAKNEATHYNIFEKFEGETQKQIFLKTTHELEEVRAAKGCKAAFKQLYLELKSVCVRLNSNLKFQLLMNIVTFYVLFIDYFRTIIFQKSADTGFDVATIICMALFTLEICMVMLADKAYPFSFYFFADVITTTFLVFDITWVANKLFYYRNYDNGSALAIKFGKIIRIVRLTRLLRFFRKTNNGAAMGNLRRIVSRRQFSSSRYRESKVTKQLKESNIKKLIILIIALLIGVPLLDPSNYLNSNQYELEDKAYFTSFNYMLHGNTAIDSFANDLKEYDEKLADFDLAGKNIYMINNFKKLRIAESTNYVGEVKIYSTMYSTTLYLSQRFPHIIQAVLDILNTLVVGLVLIYSIYNLNKDVSYLVLNPLERMIKKVKAVSLDPLKALKAKTKASDNRDEMNETLIIERAINKISELLVLGFGQAGSKIISHFLYDPDKDFDQAISGEKMHAIFGFCDIRQFTVATEVLLEDVMSFVNKIADIVHSSVDKYGGAPNKNIGEAFLLVWKLVEKSSENFGTTEFTTEELISKNHYNRQLAELSLLSFVKIIIEINTQQSILEYKLHEGLINKLPGYSVKMGFGLHVGWAIEGAIGSSFKIDASYLSPNVNLSSRLQAATKQFNVSILFSGQLFDMFTNLKLIDCCRHIDTVKVKGSLQPMRLYTIDLFLFNLGLKNPVSHHHKKLSSIKINILETLQSKFGLTSKRIQTIEEHNKQLDEFQLLKLKSYEEEGLVANTLETTEFKKILGFPRQPEYIDFKSVFEYGIESYLNGDWAKAKDFFNQALDFRPYDGPTNTIYEFIKSYEFVLPDTWKNCRELVDK